MTLNIWYYYSMEREFRDKYFQLVNDYQVWITTIGKNKKPSIFIAKPGDCVFKKVGLLSNPELFLEMLRGREE